MDKSADNVDDKDTTPPPTEEEKQTETIDDEVKPNEDPKPALKDDGPDVSARLDTLEKELAALKSMMDTLGYVEPVVPADDGDERPQESIEDLFD